MDSRKVILPGDEEWGTPIWTPLSSVGERNEQDDEGQSQRPNRAARRRMQRAIKRRNDGSPKQF